jgi:hypothetical protein
MKKTKQSPKPRQLEGDEPVKVMFTCSAQMRRRLRGRLTRDGIDQSELFRAFIQSYTLGRVTGARMGLAITAKKLQSSTWDN